MIDIRLTKFNIKSLIQTWKLLIESDYDKIMINISQEIAARVCQMCLILQAKIGTIKPGQYERLIKRVFFSW